MNQEIMELKLKGYCCSQIIMSLGLEKMGKQNPDLIAAMRGLCNGVWQGSICGILSAGVCLFHLAAPDDAAFQYAAELSEWFEDAFGNTGCDGLLAGNPLNKAEKCPMMIDATFTKISELMEWD